MTINNAGQFDSLQISEVKIIDHLDSVFFQINSENLILVDSCKEILKNVIWDEMPNTEIDEGVVSYEFDCFEMKLTHHKFSLYVEKEKEYLNRSLPWYIKNTYEN